MHHAQKWAKCSCRGNSSTKTLKCQQSGVFGNSEETHVAEAEGARRRVVETEIREECSQITLVTLRTSACILSDLESYWRILNRKAT